MYNEDEFIQLSALQHFVFCKRQCALIHIEQSWFENVLTAEGRIMHENAHEERTDARFSLTVQAGEATGWGAAAHRSIDHLKVQERTLTAIGKAKRGLEVR